MPMNSGSSDFSKFKTGPIGILIYVVCGSIAFLSLRSAGVLYAHSTGFVVCSFAPSLC